VRKHIEVTGVTETDTAYLSAFEKPRPLVKSPWGKAGLVNQPIEPI
jgi:hypothetical protein